MKKLAVILRNLADRLDGPEVKLPPVVNNVTIVEPSTTSTAAEMAKTLQWRIGGSL